MFSESSNASSKAGSKKVRVTYKGGVTKLVVVVRVTPPATFNKSIVAAQAEAARRSGMEGSGGGGLLLTVSLRDSSALFSVLLVLLAGRDLLGITIRSVTLRRKRSCVMSSPSLGPGIGAHADDDA
jgi:hypothetical protein